MKKILIATAVAAAFGMANAAEQADIVVIGAGGACGRRRHGCRCSGS